MSKELEQENKELLFLFETTLERYQAQMQILSGIESAIKEYGATVTKEYVKGRPNLMTNPAIAEYNKTATAANGTVSALANILRALRKGEKTGGQIQALINRLETETI